ncbi:hypothetical protein HMPREF3180_01824 [Leptotrichia wadei]|jgi:hypothetical protein|uniref:DUF5105 domain-containing protein n=2 Tax=Leptotrichia TaxID=32067 RepID=A0A134A115_9FUSO|nr:hypothetical protein [Leptotrichia wadei]KXB61377.1 hypothetical protein HMPREF3180_01824 [Leptotrichia wadei]BBM47774.1 hypothetical protein JMUB3933_1275 [Leptotrichia wadei]BBM50075.1 hypothetical protein JMUB3934_1371 [Leptotrichia wadei]
MKKIVILLILIIGMISFGNNYQNNSELEEEVKKVINNFNQTEKDKLFSELIKRKTKLTLDTIKINEARPVNKSKQKSFMTVMEMVTEQNLKNLIYNSKIELKEIEYVSENKANVSITLKMIDAMELLTSSEKYLLSKYGKGEKYLDSDIFLNEKIKNDVMKYFDEHTKELIKNDDNSELIVNIELEFTKKNGKWISNETISKYILKRLNGY